MKTFSILILTIFITASCAHNRIQFGHKYKNDTYSEKEKTLIIDSYNTDIADTEYNQAIAVVTNTTDANLEISLPSDPPKILISLKEPLINLSQQIKQLETTRKQLKAEKSINDDEQEVRKGKALVATGITLTITGSVGLVIGLFFLIWSLFWKSFVAGALIAGGAIFSLIGITLLIIGIVLLVKGKRKLVK